MPKMPHEFLQIWYENFKKQVYENANIDMDRKEDLGRIRNFVVQEWSIEAKGELLYTCVPNNGTTYNDTSVPTIDDADAYLQWMRERLQTPTSDEAIEQLYELSRNGTLFAFEPDLGYPGMRQIYTDEQGNIKVSVPAGQIDQEDKPGAPTEGKIPLLPEEPMEPIPRMYGLLAKPPLKPEEPEVPEAPEAPENMNPSFWSWLAWRIGIKNTDYGKLVEYQEALEAYQDEMKEYQDELSDYREEQEEYNTQYAAWSENRKRNQAKYEEDLKTYPARKAAFDKELQEHLKNPLVKAYVVVHGMEENQVVDIDEAKKGPDGLDPFHRLPRKELEFWKKQHAKVPQGQYLAAKEAAQAQLGYVKRVDKVLFGLLAFDASPDSMEFWMKRGVFKMGEHELTRYNVPKMRNRAGKTRDEIKEFNDRWEKLFEIASLAALAHPDVIADELIGAQELDGFSKDEIASMNFSRVFNDLITYGRGDSDKYMKYVDPARDKANTAVHALYDGDLDPMADLLANGIRKLNREAASLSTLEGGHAWGTLRLVSRMWGVLAADGELLKATGLTDAEIEETKANIAMHSAMVKGAEAKVKLLQFAMYKSEMTPQEVQEATIDLLLSKQIETAVKNEHLEADKQNEETEAYKEAALHMMQPGGVEKATRYMELIPHPTHKIAKNLMNKDWIADAKKVLFDNSGVKKIATMTHEELGKVISSEVEFTKNFYLQDYAQKNEDKHEKVMEKEVAMKQPVNSIS